MDNSKRVLLELVIWWATAFVGILISNYLISQLAIINNLVIILLTSLIISILAQIVRSHSSGSSFKTKWFIFYLLVYSIIILVMTQFILPKLDLSSGLLSSLVIGLAISGIILFIQKIDIRSHTIPWISLVLFCVFLVANLGYIENLFKIDLGVGYQEVSSIIEDKQLCPTPSLVGILATESDFKSNQQYKTGMIETLLNLSVWRVEHKFDTCYLGKYPGQYPNWIYCDNLIASRWETGSSGSINYRWYTAISAEWRPQSAGSSTYEFAGFTCENGQKVTVTKGTTNYYVYDSRDGSPIRIAY